MGLPQLRKWIKAHAPSALVNQLPLVRGGTQQQQQIQPHDHVFVDTNSILHQKARLANKPEQAIQATIIQLKNIAGNPYTSATRLLAFSADGVAPCAKMILQRSRRIAIAESRSKKSHGSGKFDTRQITPGCTFMDLFEQQLASLACMHLVLNCRSKPGLTVSVDGPSSSGEGELKLIRVIKSMQNPTSPHKNDSFAIVGSDSDIILQAIVSNIRCHIYSDDFSTQFSVDEFHRVVERMMPKRVVERVCLDFAAMVLFTGNDYMPKMRFIDLNILWRRYLNLTKKRDFTYIVDTEPLRFNPVMLHRLLSEQVPGEQYLGANRYGVGRGGGGSGVNNNGDGDVDATDLKSEDDSDIAENDVVEDIMDEDDDRTGNPFTNKVSDTIVPEFTPTVNIPSTSSSSSLSDIDASNSPKEYLRGILWCLEMYRTGECPDYMYFYPSKHALTMTDLANYLALATRGDATISGDGDLDIHVPRGDGSTLPPPVFAAMVLQRECQHFLDKRYHVLMDIYTKCPDWKTAMPVLLDAYAQIEAHYATKHPSPTSTTQTPSPQHTKGSPQPYTLRFVPNRHVLTRDQCLYYPVQLMTKKMQLKDGKPFLKTFVCKGESGLEGVDRGSGGGGQRDERIGRESQSRSRSKPPTVRSGNAFNGHVYHDVTNTDLFASVRGRDASGSVTHNHNDDGNDGKGVYAHDVQHRRGGYRGRGGGGGCGVNAVRPYSACGGFGSTSSFSTMSHSQSQPQLQNQPQPGVMSHPVVFDPFGTSGSTRQSDMSTSTQQHYRENGYGHGRGRNRGRGRGRGIGRGRELTGDPRIDFDL